MKRRIAQVLAATVVATALSIPGLAGSAHAGANNSGDPLIESQSES